MVSQLVRSPGVYFSRELDKTTDKDVYVAKIIPSRGAWLEFDVDKKDTVGVRIDRKRRQNVTVLLKALGWSEDEILALFDNAQSHQEHPGEGPLPNARGGPGGHLPQAPPGRAAHGRVRAHAPREPVLQPQAVRPGPRGSVQDQQEARGRRGQAALAAEGPRQAARRAGQPRQEGVGPAALPGLGGAPEGRAGRGRSEVQGRPHLRGHAPDRPLPRQACTPARRATSPTTSTTSATGAFARWAS